MDKEALKKINALPQTDDKRDPYILNARLKYVRSHMVWSDEEDQLLNELCQEGFSVSYIAQLLKRSKGAIERRVKSLGILSHSQRRDEKSDDLSQDPLHRVIRYWRNSLADADKIGLPPTKMKEGGQIPLQIIKNGQLSQEKIERFFYEAERKLKEKNKKRSKYDQKTNDEELTINKLQVIIAPYTAVKNYEHGKKVTGDRSPDEVFPLWLVASLTRSGELILDEEVIYPWIERKCLTPNENNEDCIGYPIIGNVSQVDDFYAKDKNLFDEKEPTWKTLFFFAEQLFQLILSENNNVFLDQNYSLTEIGYVLPTSEIFEASRNIITTYDQYIFAKNKEMPPLLEKFCSLKDREHCKDKSIEALLIASQNHFGQMQNKYPLSESQRISLSYLYDDEDNDIFTIHGPPGTGKTSVLLSVIASKWIDAAIQKKPPPILVIASTNNLAVTNILDHFNRVACSGVAETSIRWLPDFITYGLYLAPTHKAKEAEERNYTYRLREKGLGSIEKFYTHEYKEYAKAYFLEQFNRHYQKAESDITYCQDFIHEQMLEKQSLLHKAISFASMFYSVQEGIIKRYSNIETVEDLILKNIDEKSAIEAGITTLKQLRADWFLYKDTHLRWLRLFSWLSFVKPLLIDRVKLFTSKYYEIFSEAIGHVDSVDEIIDAKIKEHVSVRQKVDEVLVELKSIKETYERFTQEKIVLERRLGFEFSIDNLFDFSDTTNVLCKLDVTLRYELFILAMHYWEASWLLETEVNSLPYDIEGRRRYWEIQAMLTPCFVTTLHSGPGFFQHKTPSQKFETLTSFVDLLILDEAGQVMPAVAGALISTAKKALLVGDTQQIEPIFSLTEGIDLANTKKFGLCADVHDYERLKNTGILCSGDPSTGHAYGNVIVIGQRVSKFHLKEQKLPGMLLKEHRRCAKNIISYCNELCYDNQLIPMTNEKPCDYPRMGYAHIKGYEEKSGSSRFNKQEAEAIVSWIVKNKNNILTTCEAQTLDDCLGIVTPFAAQGNIIRSALYKHDLDLGKVGTVHSLQGAEKHIVIFSPVYSARGKQGVFFFDKSSNMLNVVVSRAKMSFLVFGDVDIFDSHEGNQPSSLLAKYLFAREDNEIVDIIQPKFNWVVDEEIQQINSLDKHRRVLKKSFASAKKKLNIVSPFLRVSAIESDSIPELIALHSPNIIINIYTDPTLNRGHFDEFKRAKKMLETAGATVILVNNVHSKIIAIDDRVIIEGSFNWLSASRVDQFKREESSVIYRGKHVSRFIQEAIEPIKNKSSPISATNKIDAVIT
jgi:hypothetical protein